MKVIALSELEDFLDSARENEELTDYESEMIHVDEHSLIELDGPQIQIPDLGLVVREGTMFYADEHGDWQPDWSLTLFYEIGKEPSDYVYYEQDGILVSLHNYLHAIGKEIPRPADDILCQIDLNV